MVRNNIILKCVFKKERKKILGKIDRIKKLNLKIKKKL